MKNALMKEEDHRLIWFVLSIALRALAAGLFVAIAINAVASLGITFGPLGSRSVSAIELAMLCYFQFAVALACIALGRHTDPDPNWFPKPIELTFLPRSMAALVAVLSVVSWASGLYVIFVP